MRTLLRDRNFALLLAGQTTSAFGDYAMFLAIGIWAKDLTGSNAAAGLTALPFAAPSLLGPLLGVFVDRFPRRWVMIGTDLFAALAMLTLLLVDGREDLWLLYAVSFAYGTCVTVYQGARSGLLVAMLPDDELGDANGLMQSTNQAMHLVAPLAGAGLFAVAGGPAVATMNAATFVVSALLLLVVRSPDLARRTDSLRVWPEIREGLAHIWSSLDLRRLTIGTAFVMLLVGMTEVTIYAVVDEGLRKPPEFLGVIATAQGVGAIAAGVAAGLVMRRIGELRTIAIAAFAAGIGLALFGTAALILVFVAAVGFGIANTLFMVGYTTVMQRRTPLEMQGRVMTAVEAVATLPFLFSVAVGAVLVGLVDFRLIFAAEAVGLAAVGTYFLRAVSPDPHGTLDRVPVEAGADVVSR
jgi:MFS family permease